MNIQPAASRAERLLSFNLADFAVPQGTEEEWRFTPLERMEDFFDDEASAELPAITVSDASLVEKVTRDDARLGQLMAPEDRVAALAWNSAKEAYVLTLPKETKLDSEVVVTINGAGADGVAAVQLLVDAQPFSEATVVINHVGSARLAEGIEINVGSGAHLTFVTIQDWNDDAVHTSSNRAHVARDGNLKHIVVSLGGDLVRTTTSVDFGGENGNVNLLGAYFVDEGQHIENRLLVDHNQANCVSNVTYKGALQGEEAHSVWIGDVLIQPNAEGTDTYELNRNLILTEGARADSVPNLEIETGEIEGAGHASATGRFDDEQLFYLRSRGIPEDQARRLVVRGFFAELINQIGVESVQAKLMESIEKELDITLELSE
ncbi:Fe-S cluster assembly protein SufD [Trueperella pecoris]|uniref:Fe-S cluster assembly protein SufD n=1 Tax=Trueperella pecoris TaxID=2733571 RepID=A0A7M1QXB4_9ACTO|nr:Fe-S cluster assembly protein SufD [Trueperella pecoris]QOR46752.1 Fe-S cluster assembly protein SufD [Trueperella pecoris]